LNGTTGVNIGAAITANFSEDKCIDSNNCHIPVKNAGNNTVLLLKYFIQPNYINPAPLATSTVYTATVKGGTSGIMI
jgi:hypothetical protein